MFRGNRIYKVDKNGNKKRVFWIKGLRLRFKGKNSTVIIHEPVSKFRRSKISCYDDCLIEIGTSKYQITELYIYAKSNHAYCKIGDNFSSSNGTHIMLNREDNLSCTIGDDCMFGHNVTLRTSDAHSVIDLETGKCLNCGGNISIGNHCWVAKDVLILKNVKIADNCVIGARSIVTKNCENPNSLYVGSPAKITKTGIDWRREAPKRK